MLLAFKIILKLILYIQYGDGYPNFNSIICAKVPVTIIYCFEKCIKEFTHILL